MASFRPHSTWGWTAAWCSVATLAGFVSSQVVVIVRNQTTAIEVPRLVLIGFSLAVLAAGLLAGLCSLVALLHKKDRAVAVYLALVPAGLVLLFLLGEILVPH
jgi:hypothetical protein